VRAVILRFVAIVALSLLAGQAIADDWNVVRLRGAVLQLVDNEWQPLQRGSIVPDTRVLRTRNNGYATLTRGNETIELAPNTQIQIHDRGGRKPFTTVVQHFGTVTIEAEVRNVQHFAVKNQYLAAVVKGTRFVVTAGRSGGTVEVQRGQVSVEGATDGSSTMIAAGQKAKVQTNGAMSVSGKGILPDVAKKGGKSNASSQASAPLPDNASDVAKERAKGNQAAIVAAEKAEKSSKASEGAGRTVENTAKGLGTAAEKTVEVVADTVTTTTTVVDKAVDTTTGVVDTTTKTVGKLLGG
jgi:hypothetical protein